MTDQLSTTEKNALKWVLFRDYYRGLSSSHPTFNAQDLWFMTEGFLKAIGINDD